MQMNQFQMVAEAALESMPQQFQDAMENLVICVEEEPDERTLHEMESDSQYELLGLYEGWPLPDRGISYSGHLPDTIYLYRKPILQFCEDTGEDAESCIRHVLIHEVGHYFGFSDEDMAAIEREPLEKSNVR